MRRATAGAIGAALLLFVAGFTLVALATSADRGPSAVEGAFVERGHRVFRAFEAPAFAASADVERPDVIVLVEPRAGFAPMLLAYAAEGGEVWVLAADPARTFAEDPRHAARALPGVLHGVEATGAAFDVAGDSLTSQGALALDLENTAFSPIVRSTRDAFRDTNANGRLDPGEPAGPFVVAAVAAVGEGRLAILATASPDEGAPLLVAGLVAGEARALDVVVVDPARENVVTRPAQAAVHVAARALAEAPLAGAFILLGTAAALLVARPARPSAPGALALEGALAEAKARLAAASSTAPPALLAILESHGDEPHEPNDP